MANEQESYIIDFSHTPLPHQKHDDVQLDGLMEQNPDRAARVQQWATKTGYAPEVISKDLERFEKLQSLPERAEMDDLQQNAPNTYKLITTSYDAPIVADQYREMGAFEKSWKQALNSFNVERLNAKKAEALLKQREADEKAAAYGTEFADELELLERQISAIPQPQGSAWSNWAWHTSQFGTQMLLAQPDALVGAAGGAAVGGAGGAAVGSVVPGIGTTAGAGTGAVWGARGGYVAGLAKYSYDMESAFAYEGLRNLRDKNGQPIPVEAAIKASRTVGYINAALETAGDLVFAGGVLKPVGKVAGKVAGKTIGKVLSGRIAKLPGMPALAKIIEQNPSKFEKLTLRQALIKAASVQLMEASTETSTEYAQNVVQLTAEEQAKAASGQPFERRSAGQVLEESAEGMSGVFVGSMVLGGVGAASHLANSLGEMRQAEQTAKLFKDLHDKGVKDLKLTERAPEKAIQFLSAQTNGTAVENVYVPIKAIDRVAQENKVDPHEFLQALGPEAAAQYDEAKRTNGSIEFNTADFGVKSQLLSKQTGESIFDALVNDMKADPNARTVNEVAEEQRLQQAELEKTANQAEELIKKGTAKQAELDAAKQDWLNHLGASVDYENVDAKKAEQLIEANAQLMARMDVVEAHKRGMDYFEFRAQQPRPTVQMQLSPRRQQAYEQAREMYGKLKDALVRNEETRAQQENGGLTPIIDYLIKRGGVRVADTDYRGETEQWGRKEGNIYGLVNNRNGMSLYDAAMAVQDYLQSNGWGSLIDLTDPGATTADTPDLIEAVNNELTNYVPMYKRDTYNKRLNEILNVSTGQFKTLYEKEFGEKLPDRGTRALKEIHRALLREAVKDGMKPSDTVLAEHNINAEALMANNFDFGGEDGNALFQRTLPADNFKADEQVAKQVKKDITDYENGKLPKGKVISLGTPASPLLAVGVPDFELKLKQSTITKDTKTKHFVKLETFKKLPALLADPLLILKSDTEPGSFVAVLADTDKHANRVLAAIDPHGEVKLNYVDSVYGKDNKYWFKTQVEKGNLLYINEAEALKESSRLYLRGVPYKASTNSVLTKEELVKAQNENTDPDNANIYYQRAWQGSPHLFDKFALSAIGTGEGAQAHGWGLYFAQSRAIGEKYRIELLKNRVPEVRVGDKKYTKRSLFSFFDEDRKPISGALRHAVFFLARRKNKTEAIKSLREIYANVKDTSPAYAQELAEAIKIVQSKDTQIIKSDSKNGQLYEVEIPESEVLLDEQKPFDQQPQTVQQALKQMAKDRAELLRDYSLQEAIDENNTGGSMYNLLTLRLQDQWKQLGDQSRANPQEYVSKELNQYGVKGITYNGAQDGRCFVIFDDNAIEILNTYYQGSAERFRGKFNELTNTITLTPDANASTLTHELAHYWLSERWQFVNSGLASEEYKKDFAPLAKYLDIKEGQEKLTGEQHEKFAKSFEAYLREGQSPSLELGRLFGRFRRWLIGIYRDVKNELGIELTGDIRRVFDRMLATEDEILAAERERTYEPFTNVPGMSAEDVKRLEKMREDAHNKAVTQIMQREMEELQFENQMKRIYAEEKETEAAEKELAAQPEYQLANIVESHFATSQYAKEHGKVTETLDDGTTREFTRLPGAKEIAHAFHNNELSEADRMLFSVLAENNAMTAPELAERLVRTKDFQQALAEEVDRRMEKYKLKKDMASLRRAVAEAVSNDENLAVLALERDLFMNNARAASVQRSLESKAMAKKAAQGWLHGKPAQKAAIYQPYFTAQKRAAVQTARALKDKDFETAARYKEEELFNAAAAQESIKISRQLHRIVEYFKYMQRKKMDLLKQQEHFVQVASILQRLGFGRADYDSSNKVETLKQWADRMQKRGLETVNIPDWLFDENAVLDWRRLNIDQLQDVMSALRNIHHTANFEHRLFTMNRRVNLDELCIQLSQHLAKNTPAKERAKNADNIEPEENKTKQIIEGWFNSQVKFDTLINKADGRHDFGLMHEVFLRPVKEAADAESVHLRRLTEAFQKLWYDHYSQAEIKQIFDEKKYYPELGNEATKQRLLAIALNMGNDFNKQRLFDNGIVGHKFVADAFGKGQDNNWNEQMAQQLLRNNLTAKDWDFVQGVWDLINEPWGAISEMHKRLTGFTPGKVEAVPFAIATADGKMAQLRGGYYPIKYDWRTDKRAEKEKLEEDALYAGSPATFATTKQGHTKRRVSKYSGQVSLELSLIDRHIAEVLHDLYFRPVVLDMRRLLGNPILESAIKSNLGRGGYRIFKAQLDNIADGGPYQGGVKPINDVVEMLRRNTTVSVLAAKASIIIENLANPWLFANAIEGFTGKDALAAAGFAMTKYGPQSFVGTDSARALQAFVFSKSPMMKDKSENYDVTMRQLRQKTFFGQDSKMLKTANAMVVATDDFFAIPMWYQCYKKFNDQFLREGKKADVADKLAIERADMLINRVLGSGRRYDSAEYTRSRHALVRALNMFTSFMNNEFNRWCRELGYVAKERDYERFVYFVANRAMWITCSMLLAGKWPDDLTPKELLKWWFGGAIDNLGGMFFVLRDFTPVITSKITGSYNFGYRPSPLISAVEEMIIKPADTVMGYAAGKKKGQDVLESGTKAASYIAPYPQQLNTLFFNAMDYVFNGSTPRASDLYRRRPKRERGK